VFWLVTFLYNNIIGFDWLLQKKRTESFEEETVFACTVVKNGAHNV
jgi:hypothetical protein